ncbi:MAG TPA: response regulator transcription factor [Caldilineaceae bacterium]|nr:response regulator transcription factor [Caldilineaceae bacterium]
MPTQPAVQSKTSTQTSTLRPRLQQPDTETIPPARILVVDADPFLVDLLCRTFRRSGHTALAAASAKAALQLLRSQEFELVVVDLLLPDMDGFELVAQMRCCSPVPIMVLSALTRPEEIVRALDLGADGYVCKPVIFAELEAKVKALLRRIYLLNRTEHRSVLIRGDLRLDCRQRILTIGERKAKLSATEYRLVRYLLMRPNRVVHKDELLRQVWGYVLSQQDSYGQNNVVELAIGRLRRKIEEIPSRPRRLVTVRAAGYQLRVPVSIAGEHNESALYACPPAQRPGSLDTPFLPQQLDRLAAA